MSSSKTWVFVVLLEYQRRLIFYVGIKKIVAASVSRHYFFSGHPFS